LDRVRLEVRTCAPGYVGGQETALVSWLGGGRPVPTFTPPRPDQRGMRGRPTLVQNVETLAQLALLARYGDRWYRDVGTVRAPGTVLLTVRGALARPGVLEVPYGRQLADVLTAAGGPTMPLQALLVGGYFGAWLAMPAAGAVPLTPTDLQVAGAPIGAGVVLALPVDACGLAETAAAVRWLAAQNARQCGPCRFGLPALADAFDGLAQAGRPGSAARAGDLCRVVEGRGACRHPDGVAGLAASALRVFAPHAVEHERHGPCRHATRPRVLAVPGTTAGHRGPESPA
ncbi:MAG: hypothetical protein M3P23_16295, partial [Actinomycetota bacterium]|nr:hypothetical protein [Actinomycetota bacterium]